MCLFYLQHQPSCKQFDPWNVDCLLSLLEILAPASSLYTFKLAQKTAILSALVTAKHYSDVTLLCTENQHLFLQHHAAIIIPVSGGKIDKQGHLTHQIHIESHSNVNLCPVFAWRLTYAILSLLGRIQMHLICTVCFGATIGSICLFVPRPFFLGLR